MAAVYGPIAPLNMSKEDPTQCTVSVLIKSGQSSQAPLEHEWKSIITNVLAACIDVSKFPRSVVEVVLQIIQGDGSVLGCLIHAAIAALMDSGVDLLFLPVATTCLISSQASSSDETKTAPCRLDPTRTEEEELDSTVLILVMKDNEKILASHTLGPGVSLDRLISCTQVATKASPAIVAFWRLAVEQKVTRESHTLWSH